MTVYSTQFNSTQGDMFGNSQMVVTENRMNDKGFISTDDMLLQGPTVIDGKTGTVKAITDPAHLHPTDRIEVDGIPMTVKQAQDLGISLKLDAPAKLGKSMEVTPQAKTNKAEPQVDTGPSPFTSDPELVAGDTMVQSFSFHTGLNKAEVEELGADIAMGELRDDDEVWGALRDRGISPEAARGTVKHAQQIAAQAAQRELGEQGFAELERLADHSKSIRQLVIQHGIKRMNGTAKVGWKDVLGLARQFSAR